VYTANMPPNPIAPVARATHTDGRSSVESSRRLPVPAAAATTGTSIRTPTAVSTATAVTAQ
jgi:hypothetical protein